MLLFLGTSVKICNHVNIAKPEDSRGRALELGVLSINPHLGRDETGPFCSGTPSVYQASLELTDIHLPMPLKC